MWFSLAFGSFLILTWLTEVYSLVWLDEFPPLFQVPRARQANSLNSVAATTLPQNFLPANFTEPAGIRRGDSLNALAVVLSPSLMILFVSGIGFLLNGYYLWNSSRHAERAETKKATVSLLLTGEEKAAYDEIVKRPHGITQKELSVLAGFSPVKTHRVLARLEKKKLIKTYPFGMTKKIIADTSA
jgi:uncharacterized membrane protein